MFKPSREVTSYLKMEHSNLELLQVNDSNFTKKPLTQHKRNYHHQLKRTTLSVPFLARIYCIGRIIAGVIKTLLNIMLFVKTSKTLLIQIHIAIEK